MRPSDPSAQNRVAGIRVAALSWPDGLTTARLARKRRSRGVVRARLAWHAQSMDAAAVPPAPSPRTFTSPWEAVADIAGLWMRAPVLAGAYLGRRLDSGLRERVMVAVSRVNSCAGCTRGHERWALRAGVCAAELEAIGLGDLTQLDDRSRTAVVYPNWSICVAP